MRKPRLADLGVFVAVTLALALALAAAPTLAWAQIDPGDLSLDELFSTPVTDTTASEISIRWSKPRTTLPPGVSSSFGKLRRYQVQIQGGSYSNFTQVTTVCVHASGCASSASPGSSSATATIRNLQPATAYSIRVRAVRNNAPMLPASPDEYSDWKETEATTDRPALTSTERSRFRPQGGSYTSWTRVALVCVTSQSSQCTKSVSLAAPLASTSVSGLTASTSYTFRVRAVGSNSSGPWREVVGLTKPPKVTSFTVVRPTLLAGGSLRATVRLDVPGQNVEVRISRDSLSPGSYPFLDYPDTVTIQNGDTQVFDITTTEDFDNPGTTVRLKAFVPGTATFGSGEEVARFTVEAAPVTLSMTLNPNSLTMGESARGELTLNQARPRDAAIALTSSHAAVKVPARVTLRAGETTRVFNIDASGGVTRDQQVTITAELGQTRAMQRLTVTPMVASLDGITFTPQTAKSDTIVRVTVSLGAPAAVATTVQIGTDYRDLAVPASIQFNRGEQTQTFELTAPTVDKTIVVSISAAIDRATTSANLTTDP